MLRKVKRAYSSMGAPLRASLWFTVCSFVQKGISFITVPLFTRLMTTDQYGLWSMYMSWDSIIIVFATLNLSYQVFNNGLMRYENDRDGYTTSMLGLSNLCTTVLLVLYLIFRDWVNAVSGLSTPLFLLMFAQYYFNQALALWTVKERFFYRYKTLAVVTICSAVASAGVGVGAVLFAGDKVFARVAAFALVNLIVGGAVYAHLLRRSTKLVDFGYWKYVLKLNLPLIPHYLSMTALSSIDRILIGRMCGASYTAFYSVSYNVAAVLNLLVSSINSSYIPWFYQKMAEGNHGAVSKVSTMLLLVVGGVSLVPALLGPEVILLLGSERYMEGIWVMPAVSAGVYFTFLYSLFSNYELFYEESRLMMVASLSAAVINVVLNIALLPLFGFVAAGYIMLGCYVALAAFHYAGMRLVCRREQGRVVPFNMRAIAAVSVFLLIMLVVVAFSYSNVYVRVALLVFAVLVIAVKRKAICDVLKEMKG